jgi:SAM-dependent methyltransferase
MEPVAACCLCGSEQLDLLIEVEHWRIVECRRCELGMLASRPAETQLAALYQEAYFSAHSIGYAKGESDIEKGVRGQRKRVRWAKALAPPGGTLLDVGCASGYFLAAARQSGLDAEGVEVSSWAAEEAKQRFGLRVTVGQISDVPGPHPRFDVVTMWHSLEHTRDPIATLTIVHGLLRDGGILAIELPNYQSVDARGYGLSWSGWSVPYHFWHFSPKSLSALVRRCGFDVRMIKTLPSSYIKDRVRRIPVVGLFRNLIAKWYVGRDLVLVAAKRPRAEARA